MNKIIAVDVDDTVFPSTYQWYQYLNMETKLDYSWGQVNHLYNISTLYKEELDKRSLDPMAFWRAHDTYDFAVPYPEAVTALHEASHDFDIIFVSALKGDHHKSKYYALKKHFPFMKSLLGTKEKEYVRCDYIIDDRLDNLERFKDLYAETIWFKTPAEQFCDYKPDYVLNRWVDLESILNDA